MRSTLTLTKVASIKWWEATGMSLQKTVRGKEEL